MARGAAAFVSADAAPGRFGHWRSSRVSPDFGSGALAHLDQAGVLSGSSGRYEVPEYPTPPRVFY
jgi:hypothetical protein